MKLKRNAIVFILSLFLSLGLWARVLVVTDLDDTIKQTGINSTSMVTNYIIGVEPFDKLISIYSELVENYRSKGEVVDIVYLTAAPRSLNSAKWLQEHNAPVGQLIQRRNREILTISGKQHKLNQLANLISQKGNLYSSILFFGDNGENDPLVYSQTVKKFAIENKAQVFIRDVMVTATALIPGMAVERIAGINYFLSEFDLLKLPTFDFISKELRESIEEERELAIFPDFMVDRINDRLETGL